MAVATMQGVRAGTLTDVKEQRFAILQRYEHAADLPLLILALAIVPLIVLPMAVDLAGWLEATFAVADWSIWGAFAGDLVFRTYLTDRRRQYLISHWYDAAIVVLSVPQLLSYFRLLRVLRSARVFRLLRLARATSFMTHVFTSARPLAKKNGFAYVLAGAIVILVAAAALVFVFERQSSGRIDDLGTALWWAVVTTTTVGYGDTFPVTPEGRGVAIFLMVLGVSLFGFLTANVAAFFVEQTSQSKASLDDVMSKLEVLEEAIGQLREEIGPRARA
jgi:voltage-gated potassium channel